MSLAEIIGPGCCHLCIARTTVQRPSGKLTTLKLCGDLNLLIIGANAHTSPNQNGNTLFVSLWCWPLVLTLVWDL